MWWEIGQCRPVFSTIVHVNYMKYINISAFTSKPITPAIGAGNMPKKDGQSIGNQGGKLPGAKTPPLYYGEPPETHARGPKINTYSGDTQTDPRRAFARPSRSGSAHSCIKCHKPKESLTCKVKNRLRWMLRGLVSNVSDLFPLFPSRG